MYLDPGKLFWYFGNKRSFNSRKFFGKHVIPMKLLLFGSRFVSDNRLIMPLKESRKHQEGKNTTGGSRFIGEFEIGFSGQTRTMGLNDFFLRHEKY